MFQISFGWDQENFQYTFEVHVYRYKTECTYLERINSHEDIVDGETFTLQDWLFQCEALGFKVPHGLAENVEYDRTHNISRDLSYTADGELSQVIETLSKQIKLRTLENIKT